MAENTPLWWPRGIIYQIYPRSFQDSNDDGVGDLRGVIGRLDHLAGTLAVDAVWLSTHCDREGPVDPAALRLRPNEGCIVELQALPS